MARRNSTRGRDTLWVDTLCQFEQDVQGGGKNAGDTATTIAPSALGRATIVRCRGSWSGVMTPGAAQDSMVLALGLIVANSDAVTAGSASLPGPIDEPDAPWLWVGYEPLLSGAASAQDGSAINQAFRREIDTKAMRRTKTDDVLLFVGQAVITGGTPTAVHGGIVRVLIQEG